MKRNSHVHYEQTEGGDVLTDETGERLSFPGTAEDLVVYEIADADSDEEIRLGEGWSAYYPEYFGPPKIVREGRLLRFEVVLSHVWDAGEGTDEAGGIRSGPMLTFPLSWMNGYDPSGISVFYDQVLFNSVSGEGRWMGNRLCTAVVSLTGTGPDDLGAVFFQEILSADDELLEVDDVITVGDCLVPYQYRCRPEATF